MMRDILVQIGKDQKKFEHSISQTPIGLDCRVFKVIDDCKRIGQQPFKPFRLDRAPLTAAIDGLIGANERFVEKVLETKSFACKSRWNRIRTPLPSAISSEPGSHDAPHSLGTRAFPKLPRDYHICLTIE